MKHRLPATNIDIHNLGVKNRGCFYERTEFGDLEKSFADHWEAENKPNPSYHDGILQTLFFRSQWRVEHIVTPMERYVAATAIQWLGTNCGFAFLQQCLKAVGLRIVQDETFEERQDRKYRRHQVPLELVPERMNRYSRKI